MLAETHVINLLSEEHASIRRVLLLLRQDATTVEELADHAMAGSFCLALRALESLQKAHHDPRDHDYLFPAIRSASCEIDGVIRQIELEKEAGGLILRAIHTRARALIDGSGHAGHELSRDFSKYRELVLHHLAEEDELVIPVARRVLSPEQWLHMAWAFSEMAATEEAYAAPASPPMPDSVPAVWQLAALECAGSRPLPGIAASPDGRR